MKKLHLGCGCTILEDFRNIDIDTKCGAEPMNLEQELPIEDNSIDLVVISHTLCLLQNKERLVNEIYRILKPGGWLRLIDNPIRFFPGKIPIKIDEHTLARSTLIKWLKDRFTNVYEIDNDKTNIDTNMLAIFERARASHPSFTLEAQK